MQVDQQFLNAIENTISKPRLDSYRSYFGCETDEEVVGAYLWNKAVSTGFYPLLQAVEITLRNAIHLNATNHFSGNQEWYLMRKFPEAKRQAEKCYFKPHTKTFLDPRPSPDSVVASLTFGFWVSLLTHQYGDPVKNKKLWPGLIPLVFPNARGVQATRARLHQRFKFIKDFRNRVSHHEPIWKIKDAIDGGGKLIRRGPVTPQESIQRLTEYVGLLLESLKWMSLERHDFVIEMGAPDHIRQLCTMEALHHFQGKNSKKIRVNKLKHEFVSRIKQHGSLSGMYELQTSAKGFHKGKRLVLEIKQIGLLSDK